MVSVQMSMNSVLLATLMALLYCIINVLSVQNQQIVRTADSGRLPLHKLSRRQNKPRGQDPDDMQPILRANSDPLPMVVQRSAKELCANSTRDHVDCIPAIDHYETRWKTSPKHKIGTCVIQKSMSTVMSELMCFLFNEKRYRSSGQNFTGTVGSSRLCEGDNGFNSFVAMKRKNKNLSNTTWSLNVVTRDPVDRFLSGFVDKCIRKPTRKQYCNGCGANMTCFVISEYERMRQQVKRKKIVNSFEDRHFFPQSWRCEIRKRHSSYNFLKYSSDPSKGFFDDLKEMLKGQKVPASSIKFIEHEINRGRTEHSTYDSESRKYLEERLRNSTFLMNYIVKMFHADYVLLGYPFPANY